MKYDLTFLELELRELLKESEEYHRKGYAELHKRIEDAIEYIKEQLLPYGNEWHWDDAGIEDYVIDLLDILEGKDNEVDTSNL